MAKRAKAIILAIMPMDEDRVRQVYGKSSVKVESYYAFKKLSLPKAVGLEIIMSRDLHTILVLGAFRLIIPLVLFTTCFIVVFRQLLISIFRIFIHTCNQESMTAFRADCNLT